MTGKQFIVNNMGTIKYQPLPLVTDLGAIQTRDKMEEPFFCAITSI